MEDIATVEVKFMSKFATTSVHVYQNYFDEIIEDLHAQADKNRKEKSYKNFYQNYFDEIIEDLHAQADKNRKLSHNSFNVDNLLVKA